MGSFVRSEILGLPANHPVQLSFLGRFLVGLVVGFPSLTSLDNQFGQPRSERRVSESLIPGLDLSHFLGFGPFLSCSVAPFPPLFFLVAAQLKWSKPKKGFPFFPGSLNN